MAKQTETMNVMLPTIQGLPHVSDGELENLGRLNPGWKVGRDDEGRAVMSPTHMEGGARSGEAFRQLAAWRDRVQAGGKLYDSSTGFRMFTGAVRSPDASWLSQQRIDSLTPEQRQGFWRTCPDVVIEVAFGSDPWDVVVDKIDMYRRQGAGYAVAIDPFERRIVERGKPPRGLRLDFDAIVDA